MQCWTPWKNKVWLSKAYRKHTGPSRYDVRQSQSLNYKQRFQQYDERRETDLLKGADLTARKI